MKNPQNIGTKSVFLSIINLKSNNLYSFFYIIIYILNIIST